MIQMPADFSPLDPGRIHSSDPFELEYWSRQFGCSREKLQEVVSRVGEHVNVVRQELEANSNSSARS